jgi:uncharacterized protein YlxP (DUF503 family)
MHVAVIQIELFLLESQSLKSKRVVLQSLKTRIRNKFNVSVAEVGENDKWQKAVLGIASVTNDRRFQDKIISQIMNLIESEDRVEITDHQVEIF